jgi:hypothetical protein
MEAAVSDQLTRDPEVIRRAVRERYAVAACSASGELPQAASCCGGEDAGASCCGADAALIRDDQADVFGSQL